MVRKKNGLLDLIWILSRFVVEFFLRPHPVCETEESKEQKGIICFVSYPIVKLESPLKKIVDRIKNST